MTAHNAEIKDASIYSRVPSAGSRGSVQPRFLDVVVAIALLGILFYAAWREFPTYNATVPPAPATQPTR